MPADTWTLTVRNPANRSEHVEQLPTEKIAQERAQSLINYWQQNNIQASVTVDPPQQTQSRGRNQGAELEP
jgi:hypothetical protein